jgi:hypothetical protein
MYLLEDDDSKSIASQGSGHIRKLWSLSSGFWLKDNLRIKTSRTKKWEHIQRSDPRTWDWPLGI